jgi:phosphate transport system substrate-binding protein
MIATNSEIWNEYCQRSGRAPACGYTSFYPTVKGVVAQSGDLGIAGYVSQSFAEGAIGYVNYSYALGSQFPVAKVLNKAGYYTEPTPENVAVSLLKAKINENAADPAVYLTQQLEGVYSDTDPRSYQLSSYSYFILPTTIAGQFNEAKGRTLGAVAYYMMCQAQQQSASLGYSPMPINLVQASLKQIAKIPGVQVQSVDIKKCNNPTFSPDGTNLLAKKAPKPKACDQKGPLQCSTGTGGLRNVPTEVNSAASGGGGSSSDSGSAGSGGSSSGTGGTGGDGSGTPGSGTSDSGSTSAGGGGSTGGTSDAGTPSGGDAAASGGQVAGAPVGDVVTTTLKRHRAGLGLGVLVGLLLLALIVVPAVLWRRLSGRAAT